MTEAPSDYKTAGILMLVSGVVNALLAVGYILMLIWFCIGVAWFFELFIALAEIGVGLMVLSGKRMAGAKTVSILGIVAGVFMLNPISIICEVLAMTRLGTPEVQAWLDGEY